MLEHENSNVHILSGFVDWLVRLYKRDKRIVLDVDLLLCFHDVIGMFVKFYLQSQSSIEISCKRYRQLQTCFQSYKRASIYNVSKTLINKISSIHLQKILLREKSVYFFIKNTNLHLYRKYLILLEVLPYITCIAWARLFISFLLK